MRSLLVVIFGLIVPAISFSATEKYAVVSKADITKFRTHSISHVVPAAQNMTMFYVAGLTDGCASLYLYSDKDPFLYSTALAGISKDTITTVELAYFIDVDRGPWGDTSSCKLTGFTIIR